MPSERQTTQWYFQRYVEHLPAGGEIVLFDRMAHLLSCHPYVPKTLEALEVPERQHDEGYVRPPREIYTYVPDHATSVPRAADPS